MIALVTMIQLQHMRADFTRVLLSQQSALITRTAAELDDKLGMLLQIVTLTARQQPPELIAQPAKLREYYARRSMLVLFDDVLVLDAQGAIVADMPLKSRAAPASTLPSASISRPSCARASP